MGNQMLRLSHREATGVRVTFNNTAVLKANKGVRNWEQKVSFLRQGSDSPTFLAAPTREANPPPGRPDPPGFMCGANPKQRQAAAVAHSSRQHGQTCAGPSFASSCVSLPSRKNSRVQKFCFSHLKTEWKEKGLLLTIAFQEPNSYFLRYQGFLSC